MPGLRAIVISPTLASSSVKQPVNRPSQRARDPRRMAAAGADRDLLRRGRRVDARLRPHNRRAGGQKTFFKNHVF